VLKADLTLSVLDRQDRDLTKISREIVAADGKAAMTAMGLGRFTPAERFNAYVASIS
jgi:hypothetical protein